MCVVIEQCILCSTTSTKVSKFGQSFEPHITEEIEENILRIYLQRLNVCELLAESENVNHFNKLRGVILVIFYLVLS